MAHDRKAELVHIMLVNFSGEEIVLPKATVVGVAEEVSPPWWPPLMPIPTQRVSVMPESALM